MAERKAPERRREEILDAAIELIAVKGFSSVTIRDVASAAGIAHGLLRHYFSSRDELMAAAFERAVDEEMLEPEDDHGPPPTALANWVASATRQHYLVWIDAWSEAPRNSSLRDALERHHLDCELRVEAIVARGVESGDFGEVDPVWAAKAITALCDGIAVQSHSIGLFDWQQGTHFVLDATERLLALPSGSLAR